MDLQILENTNKLKLYLCVTNQKPSCFARQIGFAPATITNYLAGRARIGKHTAELIEIRTNGDLTKEDILRFNPPLEPKMRKKKQKLLEFKGPGVL